MGSAGRFAAGSSLALLILFLSPVRDASAGGGPAGSSGDLRFLVDAASFQREEGEVVEEIYLLLPNSELRFEKSRGDTFEADVRVRFHFRTWPTGEPILEKEIDATLVRGEDEEAKRELQVLQHSFVLPQGHYRLRVEVEDRKTRDFGFFHLFWRSPKKGEAIAYFRAKRFRPGALEISDIEFTRGTEEGGEGDFAKGRWGVVPQPNRLYGALMPVLSFYYEMYDLAESREEEGEAYRVRHEVRNHAGEVVAFEEFALSAGGTRRFRRTGAVDLTSLPAGSYTLRVAAESPVRDERTIAEGSFRVTWRAGDVVAARADSGGAAWSYDGRSGEDLVVEMSPLLGQEEIEYLKGQSLAGKRDWIDRYWKERDPTPGTERNELREEHYRRIRIANIRYGALLLKGIDTDRGRLYVRYGEPDEIRIGFADQSFVRGSLTHSDDRSAIGPVGRSRGGFNVSEKEYEVWTYTDRGQILGDRGKISSGLGIRFVFVDLEGYGKFRLVESTEMSDY